MILTDRQPFTDEDRVILISYKAVVDGVSALIGEHCEIVLHSLEDIEHSAICIANGHNTNRQVGSPITDLALKSLRNMQSESVSKPLFHACERECVDEVCDHRYSKWQTTHYWFTLYQY